MDWIQVALEEYRTLRVESIEALKGQHSTLRVGTATVGVVLASGFNLWDKTPVPDFLFLVFTPAICYLVLAIWIGEVSRMMRAGSFLADLETKISSAFPVNANVLSWENWLRTTPDKGKTPQLKWNYLAIIALFFATAVASIAIGIFRLCGKIWLSWMLVVSCIEFIFFLSALIHILRIAKRFHIIQMKLRLRLTNVTATSTHL
jgi:hypothetical protein